MLDEDREDEAPEAVSLLTTKKEAFSARSRERERHLQAAAELKQRRREVDAKLKKQHQTKAVRIERRKARELASEGETGRKEEVPGSGINTKKSKYLPAELLEQLAERETQQMQAEVDSDSSLEDESECLRRRKRPRTSEELKIRRVGSVGVVALNQDSLKAMTVPGELASFRDVQLNRPGLKRMDAILNFSQKRATALSFHRKFGMAAPRVGKGIALPKIRKKI